MTNASTPHQVFHSKSLPLLRAKSDVAKNEKYTCSVFFQVHVDNFKWTWLRNDEVWLALAEIEHCGSESELSTKGMVSVVDYRRMWIIIFHQNHTNTINEIVVEPESEYNPRDHVKRSWRRIDQISSITTALSHPTWVRQDDPTQTRAHSLPYHNSHLRWLCLSTFSLMGHVHVLSFRIPIIN